MRASFVLAWLLTGSVFAATPPLPAPPAPPAPGRAESPVGPQTEGAFARQLVMVAGQVSLLVCCQAWTRALDPHSIFSSAADERSRMGLDALCDSVGLELEEMTGTGPLRIKGVLPGGPGQRAGLRPGDEIVALNGTPV